MQSKHFLWLIPFISFVMGYFVLTFFLRAPIIQTPSLIGKTIHEASIILSENQLNMRIINQKNNNELPVGTILSQSPAVHQKIKVQQSVFVVISKREPYSIIPDLRTQSVDGAHAIIAHLGAHAIVHRLQSMYPTNQCIGQIPAPHESITTSSINLYVSDGNNRPIIWPNFKNQPVNDVQQLLASYAIEFEVLHAYQLQSDHNCQNCYVADQRPLAQSLIKIDNNKKIHVQLLVK